MSSERMRAFLALDLDEPFLRDARILGDTLRGSPRLSGARWVADSALHITLRFLGEIDDALVPALSTLVARLGEGRRAIAVGATSLLAFPDVRRAHVLGLDVGAASEGRARMAELAAEAEPTVVALGLRPEPRAFRAHLTLARLRKPTDLRAVIAQPFEPIAGHVTSVALYQSVTGQAGPIYTALARSNLVVGEAS